MTIQVKRNNPIDYIFTLKITHQTNPRLSDISEEPPTPVREQAEALMELQQAEAEVDRRQRQMRQQKQERRRKSTSALRCRRKSKCFSQNKQFVFYCQPIFLKLFEVSNRKPFPPYPTNLRVCGEI